MFLVIIKIFFNVTCPIILHVQRFQPLLKERKIFFSTIKALTQVRKAQASRGFWWYGPP